MSEKHVKHVFVHIPILLEWASREKPPRPMTPESIAEAIARIYEVIASMPPEDIVIVEESPDTGFVSVPERVGAGNSARLYGGHAGVCLALMRNVLERAGIPVEIDPVGALPH